MTRLVALALLLLAGCSSSGPADPQIDARAAFGMQGDRAREVADAFDPSAAAMADVDAALAQARARGANVILVLGANWCHDSRGLAWRFEQPDVAALIARSYELVYVDIGALDRNLDVARRFGVTRLRGTPMVLVLSADGEVLNRSTIEAWRTASQSSTAEVAAYFSRWARP